MKYTTTIDLNDLATFDNVATLKRKIAWLKKRLDRGTVVEDVAIRLSEYKHRLNAIEEEGELK